MSPQERFAFYKDRIARFNPGLNAFIHLRLDEAKAEAEAAERRAEAGALLSPIDGWCIAVKANIAVAGLPHHAGIGAYKDDIAAADAEVVRRLKVAGAIILGIINMHEGALGATTDNEVFGRTQNPWREGVTPGGSSGGSGCAVAAGLCDAALGSDTMGSVRIPSAYCGIQGHKPTTGLVPDDGVLALSHTLDHVGPHARQVSGLAQILEVLAGKSMSIPIPDLDQASFGVWHGTGQIECAQTVKDGFRNALETLGDSLQIKIEPPAYAYGKSRRAGLLISEIEGHAIHVERLKTDPEGFSQTFRKLLEWGAAQSAQKVDAAYAHIRNIREAAGAIFEKVDFVLAPTAPQLAFAFDEEVPANQADFTAWADFAALPATAIYTGLSETGLPCSMQVIGPEGRDAETLAVAAAMEARIGLPPMPPGFD